LGLTGEKLTVIQGSIFAMNVQGMNLQKLVELLFDLLMYGL
jgi:hypothetical protein